MVPIRASERNPLLEGEGDAGREGEEEEAGGVAGGVAGEAIVEL